MKLKLINRKKIKNNIKNNLNNIDVFKEKYRNNISLIRKT